MRSCPVVLIGVSAVSLVYQNIESLFRKLKFIGDCCSLHACVENLTCLTVLD